MALTWSLAPSVGTSGSALIIRKMIYTGSVWVAVGDRVGTIPTNASLVWTSPDGQTWTLRTTPKGYNWKTVAFSPTLGTGSGRLVAITNSTLTGIGGTITDQVMYSDDLGATWTSANSAEVNGWNDVVWADTLGLFVAVANSGTHRVMTSTDGITWSTATAAAAKAWVGIAWDGTNLVAVSSSTSATTNVMTSTNGTSWSSQTTPISITFRNRSITYSSALGMFVAVGQSSSVCHVLRSTNGGVTWTDWSGIPVSWSNSNGGQIAWGATAGKFVLSPANSDDHVLTSTDGNVWTRVQMTDVGGDNFLRVWDAIGSDGTTCALFDQGAHDVIALGAESVASPFTSSGIATATFDAGRNAFAADGLATATFNPSLTVYSITPASDNEAGGRAVTLRGTAFASGAVVSFGKYFGDFVDATSIVVVNDTTITCVVPPHAARVVTVVVTNLDGGVAQLENGFTYRVAGDTVGADGSFSISPNHGPMSGGTLVTITGDGVDIPGTAQVYFDGVPATSVTPVSSNVITCLTPAHTRGEVDVKIVS